MNTNLCKNYEKCPIYSGVLQGKEMTSKIYREKYCEGGSEGWNLCKRYLVKEKSGKCPQNTLPNSTKSVDEIIAELG